MIDPVGISGCLIGMKSPAFLLIFGNDLGDVLMMVNLYTNILKINFLQMAFTYDNTTRIGIKGLAAH